VSEPEQPEPSCCPARKKIVLTIVAILPEADCGVPDTELIDVMRFDVQAPDGKPVIGFRFCPWCGKARAANSEMRLTMPPFEQHEHVEGADDDDFEVDEESP
jgi:hypothetical protein